MGKCIRKKYSEHEKIAKELKDYCNKQKYNALVSTLVSGAPSRKNYRFYTKLNSDGTNIGAIKFGDTKLAAHSSVNRGKNNPYQEYFITNAPDPKDTLYVNANRDINNKGNGHTRENDTEAKLLFELSQNHLKSTAKGTIYLYTYRQPCLSCDYYIINFMNKHSEVDLFIFYEIEYNDNDDVEILMLSD